jgi:hypothetical protein
LVSRASFAAELLQSGDFVEQAVPMLRSMYAPHGLYYTGCKRSCGFENQLEKMQKAALLRCQTGLAVPSEAELGLALCRAGLAFASREIKERLAAMGLPSPLEGDCRPCSCCRRAPRWKRTRV